jgi:hypothetical protein
MSKCGSTTTCTKFLKTQEKRSSRNLLEKIAQSMDDKRRLSLEKLVVKTTSELPELKMI